MPQRTNVYIDGFNFYYGALRGTSDKWLDLERYFRRLRQDDDIQTIHYFTARVQDEPQRSRQATYLRALSGLSLVNVVEGHFKTKSINCRVRHCGFNGDRRYRVPEEKRTDVNIALQIVKDAYEDECDTFVIVSGDSDLVPALDLLRNRFPEKKTVLYVPGRNPVRCAAVELRSAATRSRTLPLALLRHSQFPTTIPDGSGGYLHKPDGW